MRITEQTMFRQTCRFQVPAKGKADYTIEFLPLAMTSSPSMSSSSHGENSEAQASASTANASSIGLRSASERNNSKEIENKGMPVAGSKPEKLTGSLFFALPDGGAVLYMLEGVADAPKAASAVELDTPAKTVLAFTVPVCNWLRRAQRCAKSCERGNGMRQARGHLWVAFEPNGDR